MKPEGRACSFCNGRRLSPIIDFGEVALAGGFLKPEQFAAERKFPLRLCFCRDCYALQVVDKISPEVLFRDYFYFSSSIQTLSAHFARYAAAVSSRFLDPPTASVLEFGCNDGVLLRPLADQGIKTVIGVDPAQNVVKRIADSRVTVVNDFFSEEVAERIVEAHGRLDMIMANNVYAHISDIQGTTRAVRKSLKDDGVFVFEVHYLGNLIGEVQFDMIYHEHLYYYSLLSAVEHFARYEMTVFDVEPMPIHAGSMRFYVCKNGSRHGARVSDAVKVLEAQERANRFDRCETFEQFSKTVASRRTSLLALLEDLKGSGRRIAGYGASGRANTIIQYCGLNHEHLDYMIDDAPAKKGYYTPGSHFLIRPSDVLATSAAPDYVLLFAWSFLDEVCRRNTSYLGRGGRMILPLPEVSIYPASGS
jgi:methylation protein EvaC